ncbi:MULTISPECIES: type II CAAX prenyl endopeptidase Rce1 family protein [unclassified Coleofasciculus]|uniref:CPBP family glutamic-type intramembrane protease n=1 Tax=unclassified Coleofasciculus TaxID=2692782 RepID=UPI00187EEC96|nr:MULTISPECIES: CPBP family glutamic-type intramembrane protease [unclassified Coleofasciculus]MBE9125153.1 CPBP family intramembrane metalloprotease [Coleofasciculus sp. LEGE 07081]MBE9148370.1 CPBP family intramembrane metalloprotease [Coleofasciculus sp. LEGE 07092]
MTVALICLPIGFQSGLLEVRMLPLSFIGIVKILVSRFFFPAFAEELLFRVLLLPRKTSNTPIIIQLIMVFISLVLYVVGHPINAFLFYKKAFDILTNSVFLLSTLVLGIALTISYLQSDSIWTSIAIHWIVVVTWLLILDGYSKLNL